MGLRARARAQARPPSGACTADPLQRPSRPPWPGPRAAQGAARTCGRLRLRIALLGGLVGRLREALVRELAGVRALRLRL